MARERITEYTAKRMLLGEAYTGIRVSGSKDAIWEKIPAGQYVLKVDQGVKKRFLQGLVLVDISKEKALEATAKWESNGYSNFLLEQYIPHDAQEERYLSFERVRKGIRVLWVNAGGIDVESAGDSVERFLLGHDDAETKLEAKGIPPTFIDRVRTLIMDEYVSFIEINPLLITSDGLTLLDAAVLVDGAGTFFARAWSGSDIVHTRNAHEEERAIADLQRSTAASLKFSIINPNGALFFLLSGGGGSIVALDAIPEARAKELIGNYGEYSGGPTREETFLYSKHALRSMLASNAKKKALVIAGGVANFTDVLQTFSGVIDAIREVAPTMREAGIAVFVRRGGPNETAGLRAIKTFLEEEQLFGAVYGSETPITQVVTEATNVVTE